MYLSKTMSNVTLLDSMPSKKLTGYAVNMKTYLVIVSVIWQEASCYYLSRQEARNLLFAGVSNLEQQCEYNSLRAFHKNARAFLFLPSSKQWVPRPRKHRTLIRRPRYTCLTWLRPCGEFVEVSLLITWLSSVTKRLCIRLGTSVKWLVSHPSLWKTGWR